MPSYVYIYTYIYIVNSTVFNYLKPLFYNAQHTPFAYFTDLQNVIIEEIIKVWTCSKQTQENDLILDIDEKCGSDDFSEDRLRGITRGVTNKSYPDDDYVWTRMFKLFYLFSDNNSCWMHILNHVNTLRSRQNGRHFADDILKCTFMNEHAWILIKISLFVSPEVNLPIFQHWFR